MLITRLWPHVFHGCRVRGHYMRVPCVAIPRVNILETCMFHATRIRGPRKHVMGLATRIRGPHKHVMRLFKVYRVTTRVKMKSGTI